VRDRIESSLLVGLLATATVAIAGGVWYVWSYAGEIVALAAIFIAVSLVTFVADTLFRSKP
jgi:hypothetical protein